jgi:hypothetical protein
MWSISCIIAPHQFLAEERLTSPARALTQSDILRPAESVQIPLRVELHARGGIDEGRCESEQWEHSGELVHCEYVQGGKDV